MSYPRMLILTALAIVASAPARAESLVAPYVGRYVAAMADGGSCELTIQGDGTVQFAVVHRDAKEKVKGALEAKMSESKLVPDEGYGFHGTETSVSESPVATTTTKTEVRLAKIELPAVGNTYSFKVDVRYSVLAKGFITPETGNTGAQCAGLIKQAQ